MAWFSNINVIYLLFFCGIYVAELSLLTSFVFVLFLFCDLLWIAYGQTRQIRQPSGNLPLSPVLGFLRCSPSLQRQSQSDKHLLAATESHHNLHRVRLMLLLKPVPWTSSKPNTSTASCAARKVIVGAAVVTILESYRKELTNTRRKKLNAIERAIPHWRQFCCCCSGSSTCVDTSVVRRRTRQAGWLVSWQAASEKQTSMFGIYCYCASK